MTKGERVDRKEKMKFPETYVPSHNHIYSPSEYKNKSFERTELQNSLILTTSGAIVIKGEEKVVSGEENIQAWEEVAEFSKKKVESLKNKSKKVSS